ncbi:aminotransferase class III-fold pyridoxal phosphate-dependent enzyme [Sporolactobacillus kofuensis]|uniref:Aminotransferase class III-fold pyridoxal phosphate-dependent enzyme n=1 Tax=Sporolactobacillus kofuensis TaxID=269672 RepID=A0ABW1WE94_9BACL|nr:aminotransferase class III-fold pyridoxal phosphate-dependent enzyme [Sporolactobacillus kofuensis]MCO7174892.1 aminotransferase class III-fold pyridoxal phosphate-dependent enzyme [Sporolactobacillus kofuensis]
MEQIDDQQIKADDRRYVLHSWSKQKAIHPSIIKKAEGIFFWDDSGKKFYDMSAQLVYLNVGHNHPKLMEEFKHIGDIPFASPGFATASTAELARKIIEVAPKNMAKVFFANGGADSNDHAIKIARMVTGRYKIFSRYRSYHGATFGAGNLSGENRRFAVEPGLPGFIKFETPHLYHEKIDFESEEAASDFYLDRLEHQILYEGPESIAAIFMETIPGSNGVLIPPKGYMEGVRALCTKYGILMICDEVMSGFGRTGKMFAVDHFNLEPDMMTFAKGVTCGYNPLGGVIVSSSIADYFDDHVLLTGLTYSGHTVSTQIGCATLDIYKNEHLVEHAAEMGHVLAERLEQLMRFASVGEVRHLGLFAAVELVKDKQTKEPLMGYGKDYGKDTEGLMKKFVGLLMEQGFYTYSHDSHVMIAPPLIISEQQIHEAMDLFELALIKFEKELFSDHPVVAK